jgi:uncharacterized protein YjbI with pentapeptide repeats
MLQSPKKESNTMANQEHLDIFRQGVETWNKWRQEHVSIEPDLSGVDLSGASLGGVALNGTDLSKAKLNAADLSNANLQSANLKEASLIEIFLPFGNLMHANLSSANLHEAGLRCSFLPFANLTRANLTRADLTAVNLFGANLVEANLQGADLEGVNFTTANLSQANLDKAMARLTVFGDVDLATVNGLHTVKHSGPSIIDFRTIYRSQGNIPETFLKGAGVDDTFISYIRSLVGKPIEYYSCFISYASRDEAFAKRLYADLQSNNVRCWFAPEDMKIGAKIRSSIDQSIRLHDKLLLILSQHSVASQWVEQEVETALAKERTVNRTVLFPIRLDTAMIEIEGGWPALIRNTRNIGDFTRWKQHDAYQKAFDRLLRDLKAES